MPPIPSGSGPAKNVVTINREDAMITGYVIAALSFPHLTSFDAINKIINDPSLTTLTAMAMISQNVENANAILHTLKEVIPTLPHDSMATTINILMSVTYLIVIVALGMRFYTRKYITKSIRSEDWWALAATVSLTALFICFVISCTVSVTGKHMWDNTVYDIQWWLMWNTVCEIVASLTLAPIKISFLIFYISLSPDLWYRRTLYGVIVMFVCISLGGIFMFVFQCKPIDYWNHQFTTRCFDRATVFTWWGVLTIVSDFVTLLLPVHLVWKLQLRLKEKLIVIGIFSAGILTCVCSIMRVLSLNKAYNQADKTWLVGHVFFWCFLEIGIAIFISCLPSMKHLFFGKNDPNNISSRIVNSWARVTRRHNFTHRGSASGRGGGGRRRMGPFDITGLTTMEAGTMVDVNGGVAVMKSNATKSSRGTNVTGSTLMSIDDEKKGLASSGTMTVATSVVTSPTASSHMPVSPTSPTVGSTGHRLGEDLCICRGSHDMRFNGYDYELGHWNIE